MPVTLTPAEADTDYTITVTQADLDDAAAHIHAVTAATIDDHVTIRGIGQGAARRAWAIVAQRIHTATVGDGDRRVTSESQGDYSYSREAGDDGVDGLLAGLPSELLVLGGPAWGSTTSGRDRLGVPLELLADDFGVVHPVGVPQPRVVATFVDHSY